MNRRPAPRVLPLIWGSAAVLAVIVGCGSDATPTGQGSSSQGSSSQGSSGRGPSAGASAGSGATGLPPVLVGRVEAGYRSSGSPRGRVPKLDSDAPCPLEIETRVAGAPSRPFGAGASEIGTSGRRVVCKGSRPSTTFSVGRLDDPIEFGKLVDGLGPEQEAGNVQAGSTETVGNRSFDVVRTSYPTNDSHIDYTVTLTDPAQQAYATLQVETTGDARQTYNAAQAAQDLAAMLDSVA